ncbi:hypothetical protein M2284_000048 [Rhodococcus sp. LBL1]|nr:hypothetical protein [Rhodococcus sp. LBL1]MDH6681146.1 hypothetical protein [Rhodococcus sp. LBL2]
MTVGRRDGAREMDTAGEGIGVGLREKVYLKSYPPIPSPGIVQLDQQFHLTCRPPPATLP